MEDKESYSPAEVSEIALKYKNFWDKIRTQSFRGSKDLEKLLKEIPENVRKILDPNNLMEQAIYSSGIEH